MSKTKIEKWKPYGLAIGEEELYLIYGSLNIDRIKYQSFVMLCYKVNEQLRNIMKQMPDSK